MTHGPETRGVNDRRGSDRRVGKVAIDHGERRKGTRRSGHDRRAAPRNA